MLKLLVLSFMVLNIHASSQEKQNIVNSQQIKGIENLDWPGIYRPTSDLDNFEYSTLGKMRDGKIRGSSMGYEKINSYNNVELNKKIEDEVSRDKETSNEYKINYSSSTGLSLDPDMTIITTTYLNEAETVRDTFGETKVIRWTDENGVVNVTNNPTQIYQKSKEHY